MKYTTETTTTHRHTTRAEVLRYLKNTVFNEGIFEGNNSYDTSYIYITYVDDPEHILVIDHCSDQEALDEFKALKVADIATIQEWWASIGCTSTVEVNHTFTANGCESEMIERDRHEVEEEEPETVAAFDASPIEPATLCDSLVYVCNGQEYTINRYSDDTIESPDTGKRGHTTAQDWENLVRVLRDIMGYDVRRGAA